jgi:hypothetical protein
MPFIRDKLKDVDSKSAPEIGGRAHELVKSLTPYRKISAAAYLQFPAGDGEG